MRKLFWLLLLAALATSCAARENPTATLGGSSSAAPSQHPSPTAIPTARAANVEGWNPSLVSTSMEPIALQSPTEGQRARGQVQVSGQVIPPDGAEDDRVHISIQTAAGTELVAATATLGRDPSGHQPWRTTFSKMVDFDSPPAGEQLLVRVWIAGAARGDVMHEVERTILAG